MGDEIATPPGYTAWGPFVRDNYKTLRTTWADIIVAGTVFGLTNLFGLSAAFIAARQTRISRRPWRSAYIWMIWLELAASIVLSIICLLFLLKKIRPSFYLYMGILFCWVVQIQLLPQIIVNRIRVILMDRKRGRRLSVGTAVVITLINISVFIIWIPARLQISERWIRINTGWDRTEKVLFLMLDAYLNWYFIRTVKIELIKNGLNKYNRLVRFNKRIIVISLLCDVLIIGAMSIPNGFVYAIFHPLAYLVKLNIEMSMAHLIRSIALASPNINSNRTLSAESKSSPESSPFNTDVFAEVAMPRRTFFRGLFSNNNDNSNNDNLSHQVEERTLQRDSAHSTTTPVSGADSLELKSIKKSDSGTGDEPHHRQVAIADVICGGDIIEESEISNSGQYVRVPEPIASPSRMKDGV